MGGARGPTQCGAGLRQEIAHQVFGVEEGHVALGRNPSGPTRRRSGDDLDWRATSGAEGPDCPSSERQHGGGAIDRPARHLWRLGGANALDQRPRPDTGIRQTQRADHEG